MNKNYLAGRRFEYETQREWEDLGYSTSRTAGSHGPFDVIAFTPTAPPVFIQCKRTSSKTTANRMGKTFKKVTISSPFYSQVLTVKVKGTKEPFTYSI